MSLILNVDGYDIIYSSLFACKIKLYFLVGDGSSKLNTIEHCMVKLVRRRDSLIHTHGTPNAALLRL